MIEYNFSDILRYFKASPHTFTSNGKSIQKLTLGMTSFPVAPRWNLLKRTPATMYTRSKDPKLKKQTNKQEKTPGMELTFKNQTADCILNPKRYLKQVSINFYSFVKWKNLWECRLNLVHPRIKWNKKSQHLPFSWVIFFVQYLPVYLKVMKSCEYELPIIDKHISIATQFYLHYD